MSGSQGLEVDAVSAMASASAFQTSVFGGSDVGDADWVSCDGVGEAVESGGEDGDGQIVNRVRVIDLVRFADNVAAPDDDFRDPRRPVGTCVRGLPAP